MEKQWKVVITLEVNHRGADFDRWKAAIERNRPVMEDSVMLDVQGRQIHIHMVVASEVADYGVTQALRSALSAYRRSYRAMRFSGSATALIVAVKVEKTKPEPSLVKKGSE